MERKFLHKSAKPARPTLLLLVFSKRLFSGKYCNRHGREVGEKKEFCSFLRTWTLLGVRWVFSGCGFCRFHCNIWLGLPVRLAYISKMIWQFPPWFYQDHIYRGTNISECIRIWKVCVAFVLGILQFSSHPSYSRSSLFLPSVLCMHDLYGHLMLVASIAITGYSVPFIICTRILNEIHVTRSLTPILLLTLLCGVWPPRCMLYIIIHGHHLPPYLLSRVPPTWLPLLEGLTWLLVVELKQIG